METISPRAGFLCNHEVLAILKGHRDARAKLLAAVPRAPGREEEEERIQPQDLHTVTFECIKYLEEDKHPIRRQTTESITKLLDELEKLDLTRAERLQIVNLAPTTLVALVVCVDDFEERFPTEEEQAHILGLITDHMGTEQAPTIVLHPSESNGRNGVRGAGGDEEMDDAAYELEEEDGDLVQEGLEGAGEATERGIDEEDA